MQKVYLDNAATTKVTPEVEKVMEPYFGVYYGNASSIHSFGREAKEAIQKSRGTIAKILNCLPEEIIFTSCATESNNLAIKGVVAARQIAKPHIITTKIEHHSVLHTCEYLEKSGQATVTYLSVSRQGIVNPVDVEKAIRPNTVLVSIMYANNEIGSIQSIQKISQIIEKVNKKRKSKILFHTDAVQAFQYLDCDIKKLGVDMLSLTGHKFYGCKGIGILYIKKDVNITPQIHGGGHEFGLRSGTENVPYIVGITKAMALAGKNRKKESARLLKLRDKLIKGILKNIPKSFLSGGREKRLPNNVNICFPGVEGESIVLRLDKAGIAASTGSACTSASLLPSHVLVACGIKPEVAHGSLRLTLGKDTKEKDINYVIRVLPKIISDLRKMSPLWAENPKS